MNQDAYQNSNHSVTVWYDGGCPLCVREIGLMHRLDTHDRIRFVDIDREDATCPIDRDLLLARLHAREGDGELVDGAAAFAAMWRAIPVMRPLGLMAKYRAVLWLLERAYRGFLVVRPAVQRVFVRIFGDSGDRGAVRGS
jgi:predicted DCC family thiol-disulfide oxidoreductase YuxK